ncbi:antibiotic biosynthesis monooxygenase [Deinococcus planocerae]|uniref:antibiotic biosynthesis monooxygenase n=1 Tax=Deinococcus planocerae TaxID=1737569 RepID=UPI000C7EFBCD|nr:antibiotic biosynthesis monooxygenase [Deinococcus planocerae]
MADLPLSPDAAPPPAREGVTLVVTEFVRPSRVPEYEAWASDLHARAARQAGFVGVHVLRGQEGTLAEYVTLVRFASPGALAAWRASPDYQAALERLPEFTAGEVDYRESVGLEAWFDRPARPTAAPPLWKNVVLGFAGVYPLILLFTWLCRPLVQGWPWWAAILPSALLATVFLNWPVLPLLSRLLRGWLYPERR